MNYEIYKDGELINTIYANESFVIPYCEKNGYTYKLREEPVSEDEPAYTDEELREQEITDLWLSDIEQWQEITEIQLQLMEVNL